MSRATIDVLLAFIESVPLYLVSWFHILYIVHQRSLPLTFITVVL